MIAVGQPKPALHTVASERHRASRVSRRSGVWRHSCGKTPVRRQTEFCCQRSETRKTGNIPRSMPAERSRSFKRRQCRFLPFHFPQQPGKDRSRMNLTSSASAASRASFRRIELANGEMDLGAPDGRQLFGQRQLLRASA